MLRLPCCVLAALALSFTGCASTAQPADAVTEVYSVRDLCSTPQPWISVKDLATNLADATGAEYWRDQGSIRTEDSGILAVTANVDMQEKVRMVLADMRKLAK
ncbi:MAG: hypothetical protein H6838_16090 [Planctomycetes bacterium]|nr:hypothetical protein [Planctomycetota bacterium]MCB9887013.1 hypothetical protein [Planctomycetota bacterium]